MLMMAIPCGKFWRFACKYLRDGRNFNDSRGGQMGNYSR